MDALRSRATDCGTFLRREAIAVGYDDRDLRRALKAGQILRVRTGAFAFADDWGSLSEGEKHVALARAVVRTAKSDVVISHISALAVLGVSLWDLPLTDVHVTRRDAKAGHREAGVIQHRGLLREQDMEERGGVRLTSPARSAVDVAGLTDLEHTVVIIDWLQHRGLTNPAELEEQCRQMTFHPGTRAAKLAIKLADGRSESVGESRVRVLCWLFGLPAPVPNYEIRDDSGRVVARVDLAWPELGVYLEFDGRDKYLRSWKEGESVADVVLREKAREDMINELTGWSCIRLVWRDLYTPEATAERIRRKLRRRATA